MGGGGTIYEQNVSEHGDVEWNFAPTYETPPETGLSRVKPRFVASDVYLERVLRRDGDAGPGSSTQIVPLVYEARGPSLQLPESSSIPK